jgi:hypothetical protein
MEAKMARPMMNQSAAFEPWFQYLKQLKTETPDFVPELSVRGMDTKRVREPLEAVMDSCERRVAYLRARHVAQSTSVVPFGRRSV